MKEPKNESHNLEVADIVIELVDEVHVKIRQPDGSTKIEDLRRLGFKRSTSKEVRIFKSILKPGEYIRKGSGGTGPEGRRGD